MDGLVFPVVECLLGLIAADISLGVIHDRANRPTLARQSEVVNNSAAGENSAGGRPASARSRSYRSDPQRIKGRLPGEPKALAPTSNRKAPQEGHNISLVDSRAKRRKNQSRQRQTMNDSEQWKQHRAYGALDWASEKPRFWLKPEAIWGMIATSCLLPASSFS